MSALALKSVVPEDNLSLTREAVNEALLEILLSDVNIPEAYEVKIKPDFKTASWTKLPPHSIYVGDSILTKARKNLKLDDRKGYIKAHVHHEFGHLLFTDPDLKHIQRQLAKFKAPFSLFNLFEDARIEELYRVRAKMRFSWTKYETLTKVNAPTGILFNLIQVEGNLAELPKPMREVFAADAEGVSTEATVLGYYKEALKATSSSDLLPLVKRWCEQFGAPDRIPGRGNEKGVPEAKGGMGDLEPALDLPYDTAAQEAFEDNLEELNPKDSPEDKVLAGSVSTQDGGNADLLSDTPVSYDERQVGKLAKRLGVLFRNELRAVTTGEATKRLSTRHIAMDDMRWRTTRTSQKACRKKLLIIVDCSGSMSIAIEQGRLLVAAFSQLAKTFAVSGHVVLSAVRSGESQWQRFRLPMSRDEISRIETPGEAEGLEYTLRSNGKLAKDADLVMVYTDAQIGDAVLNKRKLHTAGIYTWGLYAGTRTDCLEELLEYFDKATMRETAEQLVEAMLLHV